MERAPSGVEVGPFCPVCYAPLEDDRMRGQEWWRCGNHVDQTDAFEHVEDDDALYPVGWLNANGERVAILDYDVNDDTGVLRVTDRFGDEHTISPAVEWHVHEIEGGE